MAEPYIGEIRLFPYTFAPKFWAFCDGQMLPIKDNDLLYAVIGTTYGGDGITNFALPDLRGRVPIHMGRGPSLTPRSPGQGMGTEIVKLDSSTMPQHNHNLRCSTDTADQTNPTGAVPATTTIDVYSASLSFTRMMDSGIMNNSGSGDAHTNMMPFLVLNFCIALKGIYPPRQ